VQKLIEKFLEIFKFPKKVTLGAKMYTWFWVSVETLQTTCFRLNYC